MCMYISVHVCIHAKPISKHFYKYLYIIVCNLKRRHHCTSNYLHTAATIVTDDVILCLISAVARWQCSAAAVRVAVVVTLTLSVATRQNDAVTVTVTVNHGARRI